MLLQPIPDTAARESISQRPMRRPGPLVPNVPSSQFKLLPTTAVNISKSQHGALDDLGLPQLAREERRVKPRVVYNYLFRPNDLQHPRHQLGQGRLSPDHIVSDSMNLADLPRNWAARVHQGVDQGSAMIINNGNLYDRITSGRAEPSCFGVQVYRH